jgi:hypothetical protein
VAYGVSKASKANGGGINISGWRQWLAKMAGENENQRKQRGERHQSAGEISKACSESGNLKGYQRMKMRKYIEGGGVKIMSAAVAKIGGK